MNTKQNTTYLSNENRRITIKTLVFLFVLSAAVITLCSKCSPIYPFNNWDDTNSFFTVGKAIANGKVVYRDIYEQKGPLLYYLFVLVYRISETTFIGAYIFEIAAAFLFLLLSLKTIHLFTDKKVFFIIPVVAATVYGCNAFQMGGSVEEFCLPLIMYCFYTAAKAVMKDSEIGKLQWLIIGVTSGIVLWSKFSLLGFYLGFGCYIIVYYIKRKQHKKLFSAFVCLFCGIVISSMPVIIYCTLTRSFSDMFQVYFYDNIFHYSTSEYSNPIISKIMNYGIGAATIVINNIACIPMLICFVIYCIKRSQIKILILVLAEFICAFLLIYAGGKRYDYYSLILSFIIPVGLISLYNLLENKIKILSDTRIQGYIPAIITGAAMLLLLVFLCPNTYMLKYKKDDLPQYKFTEYILQSSDPTLLNYGSLDGGFYTVSGIVPDCKYFCVLNLKTEELISEQDKYIKEQPPEYIVSKEEDGQYGSYTQISSAEIENRKGKFVTYFLYKRNE